MTLAVEPVLDPGWSGLALALAFAAGAIGAALLSGVRLVREGLVATARTVVQLVGVGLVLEWVFARDTWFLVLGVLALMTAVAGATGSGRVERALRGTGPALTAILAVVLAVTLLYVTQVVVGVEGVASRYWIPLGGMILGNAMTAGSLAAQRLHDELRERRDVVEAALALGATPAQAARPALRRALRAAFTPAINAMMVVGIVKLPGVMTGQMLGGSAPFEAAKYQVVVMLMLFFGDAVTAVAVVHVVIRLAFTRAWQPRL